MSKILVVDDEQAICWALVKLGRSMGHELETAASAEEGLQMVRSFAPDLLILDVRLPGKDGLSALADYRSHIGDAPVIVITAFGALDIAVKTVRSGAFEYIIKPFDLAEVRSAIERALNRVQPIQEASPAEFHGEMVGYTPIMQALFKRIALAASSRANVLLHGESGAGKELAARAIHSNGSNPEGPFIAVNVAALSPTLAESELFGHVDGAFTGANRSREGLLVQANGGTLFLDEVADIPLPLQVKLLRAIEQGEVLPVGADKPVKTAFRVVAATHQDLQSRVRSSAFRHDLFFRICAFEIDIPPLRERSDDIPLLAAFFANQVSDGRLTLSELTVHELKNRPWYGNVRELRNAIEHAGVVARRGIILPEHLPRPQPCFDQEYRDTQGPTASLTEACIARSQELLRDPDAAGAVYEKLLFEVEAPLLRNAMKHFENECAPAARALGLHRTTLKRKLLQLNLVEQAEPQ